MYVRSGSDDPQPRIETEVITFVQRTQFGCAGISGGIQNDGIVGDATGQVLTAELLQKGPDAPGIECCDSDGREIFPQKPNSICRRKDQAKGLAVMRETLAKKNPGTRPGFRQAT